MSVWDNSEELESEPTCLYEDKSSSVHLGDLFSSLYLVFLLSQRMCLYDFSF